MITDKEIMDLLIWIFLVMYFLGNIAIIIFLKEIEEIKIWEKVLFFLFGSMIVTISMIYQCIKK